MGNRTIHPSQHKPHAGRPRWMRHAICSVPAVGLGAGIASFAIRSHEWHKTRKECARLENELGELGKGGSNGKAGHLANESLDEFLRDAVSELRVEKEHELSTAKSHLSSISSGLDSHTYAFDGIIASIVFAGMLSLAVFWQKISSGPGQTPPEGKEGPLENTLPEPGKPGGASAPPKGTSPEPAQFPFPPYYDGYFPRLKRAIQKEMGTLGSEEAAEVLLRVLPIGEVEEIIRDRGNLPYAVRTYWGAISTLLTEEKKIEPERLFSRLEFDTLDIF